MKNSIILACIAFLILSSCSSHQKKILVYANSNIQTDESNKTITVVDGNTQVEKELSFSSSDPVVLNINSPSGHFTLEVADDGYWLANLKKDTIVGSMQHTGTVKTTRITQDQLKMQLDSLNQLVKGANISAASKNFFLPPGKIVKISNLTDIKVFGPYTPVPSAFDASSVSEIYKFYTLPEEVQIINKLTEMSKYNYEKGDEK